MYHCCSHLTRKLTYLVLLLDGLRIVEDFLESPSQMLGTRRSPAPQSSGSLKMSSFSENWCYHPQTLKSISKHHETGEPMPDDLIDKIIKCRFVNQGLFVPRQLSFGKYDLMVHGQSQSSPSELQPAYPSGRCLSECYPQMWTAPSCTISSVTK